MCNKLKQLKFYQQVKSAKQKLISYLIRFLPENKVDWVILGGLTAVVFVGLAFMGHSHGTVAVVDMDRLREEAEPYQEIEREKAKYAEIWRVKFRAEQDVLDEQDKKLAVAQKKKNMKKKAFKKALDELQKKSLALQEKYQKEASKIMMATESARAQIDELALKAASKVAQDLGYDIVLNGEIIYASDKVDMTDALIEELNKTAVKINYPDPEILTPEQE